MKFPYGSTTVVALLACGFAVAPSPVQASDAVGIRNGLQAVDYEISPDGSGVVRLVPLASVPASRLGANESLLTSLGWRSTQSNGVPSSTGHSVYKPAFDSDGLGGARLVASFFGPAPTQGKRLDWVQVFTANGSIPALDNIHNSNNLGCNPNSGSKPFYPCSSYNSGLLGPTAFFDFARIGPARSALEQNNNSIRWNAELYPVIADDDAKTLTAYNGLSWGYTMEKTTVGSVTGSFSNPAPSTAATSGGNGGSSFSWGSGTPSSLSFSSAGFDTWPGEVFKLGTLTYTNGRTRAGTEANSVGFGLQLSFDNIPEIQKKTPDFLFSLVNTPNTDDPFASSDRVSIADWGASFLVEEGATASVDIEAILTAQLIPNNIDAQPGRSIEAAPFTDHDISADYLVDYVLRIIGLSNPTAGGYVVTQPQPPTSVPGPLPALGVGAAFAFSRQMRRRIKASRLSQTP